MGNIDLFFDYEWNENKTGELQHTYRDYFLLSDDENRSFTSCLKYKTTSTFKTNDNKIVPLGTPAYYKLSEEFALDATILLDTMTESGIKSKEFLNLLKKLEEKSKIKHVALVRQADKNESCVKNYKIINIILSNFPRLEKFLINAHIANDAGFSKTKNPYLYGEVSISRTARFFPANYIFKPFIILTALFLFFYWRNNLNLFNDLKGKKELSSFSKKFYYFGLLSCLCLSLHALFLGIEIESKIFSKIRKLIIVLFIFSEVVAQILLTINIYKFREILKTKIISMILKIKIFFVSIIFLGTSLSLYFLIYKDLSNDFKHILEWNYFSALLFYYFLSSLLWKTRVHTPEGV